MTHNLFSLFVPFIIHLTYWPVSRTEQGFYLICSLPKLEPARTECLVNVNKYRAVTWLMGEQGSSGHAWGAREGLRPHQFSLPAPDMRNLHKLSPAFLSVSTLPFLSLQGCVWLGDFFIVICPPPDFGLVRPVSVIFMYPESPLTELGMECVSS